jgi:DNA-binding phage protein
MSALFDQVARQVLRGIRGERSQVAFSRRLGFRSNVAAKWESGQRLPTAAQALLYSHRLGIDVTASLGAFHPATAAVLSKLEPARVAAWLEALRGTQSVSMLSARSGLSRFSVGRFLSARSEPRLSQFLRLVDALTDRLPDFVDAWVGIEQVPALASRYQRVQAARAAMFEQPLCLAVLCLLDTRPLDVPARAQLALLAKTLGRSPRAIRLCLDTLLRGRVLGKPRDRYVVSGALSVDSHSGPERERAARSFWTGVALRHVRAPTPADLCSYNVFSVTRADYEKLKQLQREFFRGARALIAASEPTEMAGLLLVNLVGWEP